MSCHVMSPYVDIPSLTFVLFSTLQVTDLSVSHAIFSHAFVDTCYVSLTTHHSDGVLFITLRHHLPQQNEYI